MFCLAQPFEKRLSMRSITSALRTSILAFTLVVAISVASAQPPGAARGVKPVAFGGPFPLATYGNMNKQAGGPEQIDLAASVGKKPVVLFYWIAGNARADRVFQELQALSTELGSDQVVLYGVALERPGRGPEIIEAKLRELKITVPVLDDKEFRILQQLQVRQVPNITILDGEGQLRLSNAANLEQELEYKMTVETAIRRVAQKGTLSTYGFLPNFHPVMELVGEPCPDFEAALLSDNSVKSWHGMLSKEKLNVLIFWSIDCPHCRRHLPEINAWLKENPDKVNVVSVAQAPNDAVKRKTKQFTKSNGFVFPTLVDADHEVTQLFEVTSTPTSLIIRPDGVVDSVLISSVKDFGRAVAERIDALLKSGS
jgi:peroxiredoxin